MNSSKRANSTIPLYVANNADRCYHCKDELFDRMEALAKQRNFSAIAYGINADDTRDFRPGHRAAREHRVLAPLLDADLHKDEIRQLSRRAGLPTWDRPASACLSSRIPYGIAVTPELLDKDRSRRIRPCASWAFASSAFALTANSRASKLAPDELARGFAPGMPQQIAARAEGARLRVRHARSGRLSPRLAQFSFEN